MIDEKYRYKKTQIFRKKIDVPKGIQRQIYNNDLSLENYIMYDLYNKVPTSCLQERDREAVERIGIEKFKKIDYHTYNRLNYYIFDEAKRFDLHELIINAPSDANILELIEDEFKDKISPEYYTKEMVERFSDRVFDLSQIPYEEQNKGINAVKKDFNSGFLSISEIVQNWNILKDKDLSRCLEKNNYMYNYSIKKENIQEFMNLCGDLSDVLIELYELDGFINDLGNNCKTEEEKNNFIIEKTKRLLNIKDSLTEKDYRTFFKYYPIKNFIRDVCGKNPSDEILNFINGKGWNIIFNSQFKPNQLLDKDILDIMNVYYILNNKNNDEIFYKIVSSFHSLKDKNAEEYFKSYIEKNIDNIDFNKINKIMTISERLSFSNSSELNNFKSAIFLQLLDLDDPIKSLDEIEKTFIKNNIPIVGKVYSVFQILHPNCEGFNFSDSSTISPVLKSKSNKGRNVIIFSDLVKAALGSNNRSLINYINNIEKGTSLYLTLKNQKLKLEELSEDDLKELETFKAHLLTLYDNTLTGKLNGNNYQQSDNIISDIDNLVSLFSINKECDISDRVISMFCHFAGIDTLKQAKDYIHNKVGEADQRNRESVNKQFEIKKGDLVKGITDVKYLGDILQNGSVSKEFLDSSASSDNTPLDTDLSMITIQYDTISDCVLKTAAKNYGSILFILKNNNFNITRTRDDGNITTSYDPNKLELFYTGLCDTESSDHYGIRTGFASSDIDYIILQKSDDRIGLEIAKNGFYIPVCDVNGEIIFTPNDYDNLRAKMGGLSRYGEEHYHISNHLDAPGVKEIEEKVVAGLSDTKNKKDKINRVISLVLEKNNLQLKTKIDGDLTPGSAELIDTGSTGRGTNKPGDGDFDFMMRLDKAVLLNKNKLEELKKTLLEAFGKTDEPEITSNGDFRLKNVVIDDITVDIDITFTGITDKISYSTDMCLHERLDNIKKQYPDKYFSVVANILLAKQVLKEANAYKPYRSDNNQGGIGGVGIENWILQNGGSFIDASLRFLSASKEKTYEEFKKAYQIWDFGENHMSEVKKAYVHDNFVECNMSADGYDKMRTALIKYISNVQQNENNYQIEESLMTR